MAKIQRVTKYVIQKNSKVENIIREYYVIKISIHFFTNKKMNIKVSRLIYIVKDVWNFRVIKQ